MKKFQIIIAGAAGEGSKKGGLIIAKIFNAYGYKVFIHEDYESVIQGGHNFSQISVSEEKREAVSEKIDFLLALNKEALLKHGKKLSPEGVAFYDSAIGGKDIFLEAEKMEIPVDEILNESEGIPLMKNTALLSFFTKAVGLEWEDVKKVLEKEFSRETEKNIKVATIAFKKAEKIREIEKKENSLLPLFSGNQAVALGALDAGLECYFAYPMTPSTGVLQFLSNIRGVRTFQPENEIAVVNSALGSAYAGKRTMVGTSGGGFALMTEGVSLSAQAEVPLCIVLSQRMGPATGVPTYEAQGDLLFALHSGHGDMKRFIVAPGDVKEAYYLTGKALNIAWKYQLPSIVLMDKELSENTYQLEGEKVVKKEDIFIAKKEEDYNRYEGEDISPLLFPGGNSVVKVTGYEHNKKGITTEKAEEVKAMHEKRLRKYALLEKEIENLESVKVYERHSMAVVFWGSTKGAVIEAAKGLDIMLVQPLILQPFPEEKVKEALRDAERIVVVENNATGQLAQVLKMYGILVDEEVLRYDGRPFTIEELRRRFRQIFSL